jgi:hypothetical protein
MKNKTLLCVLIAVASLIVWASWPPPQQAPAQDWYGPNVTSDLKHFNVDCTTNGNNTIIAAKAGSKFRIVSITVTSCSTSGDSFYLINGDNALWYSAAIPMPIHVTGIDGVAGISLAEHNGGHFETDTVNEALVLVLTDGDDANCSGTYVEIF